MITKICFLILLPFLIAWVVVASIRETLIEKSRTTVLADSGRFDPTEALYGIL